MAQAYVTLALVLAIRYALRDTLGQFWRDLKQAVRDGFAAGRSRRPW